MSGTSERGPRTRAVHAALRPDPETGAVVPPIHLATTYERDSDGEYPRGFLYTRDRNPTRSQLEAALSEFFAAEEAYAFGSGMAAVHALFELLPIGAQVVVPRDAYYGAVQLLERQHARRRLDVRFLDAPELDQYREAITADTALIWVETPSNPPAARQRHRRRRRARPHAPCAPRLRQHLGAGAPGSVRLRRRLRAALDDQVHRRAQRRARWGRARAHAWRRQRRSALDPEGARRAARSLLGLADATRAAHAAAAHRRAEPERDASRELPLGACVRQRRALPRDSRAIRNMRWRPGRCRPSGACSPSSWTKGEEAAFRCAAACRLFTRATSLGGFESLIEHRRSIEKHGSQAPAGLLRCSIGLEDAEDLEADLAQALAIS